MSLLQPSHFFVKNRVGVELTRLYEPNACVLLADMVCLFAGSSGVLGAAM
jgi:hypothetical protein